jgi:leucyl aminopeptidase
MMVMKVTVDTRAPVEAAADLLALPFSAVGPKSRLESRLAAVDRATRGQIRGVIRSGDFRGKPGETLLLYPTGSLKAKRVLLIGLGAGDRIDAEALRAAAGHAVAQAAAKRAKRVALTVPAEEIARSEAGIQALAEGAVLAGYHFDEYKRTEEGESAPVAVAAVSLLLDRRGNLRAARSAAHAGAILAESQNTARDLSNQPANALPPAGLARAAQETARETGLKVRVLDVPELRRRKMGAILAVGGGSANPPRLIALEHAPRQGKGKKRAPLQKPFCIVGKGITFDSGGISIKPSAGMDEMKHDMSGAATVVGALRAAALLDLPVPVVGVIGAAENMPSATAYRPGDVVTAMSGKTIEVLNTDAEGRVVLADALHYARTQYDPCAIVDLATLTGACVVGLGRWASGLFGNHPKLIEIVRAAGDTTGETAWPMPLLDAHKDEIRSQIATIKNTGGREAGASTAAAFLWHFVGDTPWVHLDIAGTGWMQKPGPYQRRGATGVGVRLLLEVLRNWDPSALD